LDLLLGRFSFCIQGRRLTRRSGGFGSGGEVWRSWRRVSPDFLSVFVVLLGALFLKSCVSHAHASNKNCHLVRLFPPTPPCFIPPILLTSSFHLPTGHYKKNLLRGRFITTPVLPQDRTLAHLPPPSPPLSITPSRPRPYPLPSHTAPPAGVRYLTEE